MPLSEYEQRVLEQMERQLSSDDPRLANTLTQRGRRPLGRYVIAGLGAVVGLLLLVFGAAFSQPLLGVIGFIVMFAAVAYAFARPHRQSGPSGVVAPDGTVRPTAGAGRPKAGKPGKSAMRGRQQGFMSRLEERWDRRRGDQGRL